MKLTFIEKYGPWLGLALFAVLIWSLVNSGMHLQEEYALFFPLNWLQYFPFGDFLEKVLSQYRSVDWWMWIEIGVAILVWVVLYLLARGGYYFCSGQQGGVSMWIAFIMYVVIVLVFFALVLRPVFSQMGVWWKAWPGANQMTYPGGTP